MVEALAAGDGLSPDGEGLPAGDGDGLPEAAHILSAVAEPALLSTSVVVLHMVQFVQVFWLDAAENCPLGHATQVRSVLLVPLVAMYWPLEQSDHGAHITPSSGFWRIVHIALGYPLSSHWVGASVQFFGVT